MEVWFLACLRSPSRPFYPFLEEGSPTKIGYRKKKGFPCSNLSTGGPSVSRFCVVSFLFFW